MGTKTVDASGGGIGRVSGFGSTPLKLLTGSFTFSDSYATGGEAFDVTEYFSELKGVIVSPAGGRTFTYDATNKKILAYSAATTQVTAETDLSAVTVTWIAFGW